MRWTEKQLAEHLERTGAAGAKNRVDVSNPPFRPVDMLLDLPAPISVNRMRRVDWKARKNALSWREMADKFLEAAMTRGEVQRARLARYELQITLSEQHCRIDADNGLKLLIDYLRYAEIVLDDSKKNLRRIVVEWGHAPAGCRVLIKPMEG